MNGDVVGDGDGVGDVSEWAPVRGGLGPKTLLKF